MLNRETLRRARIVGVSLFALALTFVLVKFYVEFRNASQRGKVVASVVHEQASSLRRLEMSRDQVREQRVWPDDFSALQYWVVLDLAREGDPEGTRRRLIELTQGHEVSPVLRTSLDRWNSHLTEWSRVNFRRGATLLDSDELIRQGRRRNYEATGYRKVGRLYDATVLYLWSADSLSRYIELNPTSAEVPEALYLLGEAHIHFRNVLPRSFRSDRLLNLCSEFFPSTVWAQRSNRIWNEELKGGGA
jgi:hypothetical protein